MTSIPVQRQFSVHIASGQAISNQTVTIPAGKRLIIENVSGKLIHPSSQIAFVSVQTTAFQIDVPGGTTTGFHFFPTTVQPSGTNNEVVFGQRTYIGTVAGSNVVLTVSRNTTTGSLDGQV